MSAPRRILFVNRFYFPDHSATAQILTDLAEALTARGWAVTVITSRLRYDDPSAVLAARAEHGGVDIRRIWTSRFGRGGLAGRAMDYLSFYATAVVSVLAHARRGDLVVAKTDPPLLSIVLAPVVRLKGARLVNWLQDVFPEIAAALGMRLMSGPVGGLVRAARNASLKSAHLNVVIGERMARRLVGEGVPAAKIAVMPNWTDDREVQPLKVAQIGLRKEWGLRDRFVVGYSGNLGRAHEAETVLGAARLLFDRKDIVFLMVGGGHAGAQLAARVADDGLSDRFMFRPYQARERLGESLGAADVHWLSLRPEMEGLIVPSKFYGIAAAGRPIIAVTALDGEIATLVQEAGCGLAVAPGDSAGLAAAIAALASDPLRVSAMGSAARRLLERDYDRATAFARWDALLRRAAGT